MCSADLFLALLAILFPPLPVWVKRGICSADSVINFLLFLLGYVPGLIHSWAIICKYPEPPFEYEAVPSHTEGGHVTYVYVQAPCNHQPNQQPKPQGQMNYGTTSAGSSGRPQQPQKPQQPAQPAQSQEQGVTDAGEGSSDHQGVPPSYAEVVAGDHKIQSKD